MELLKCDFHDCLFLSMLFLVSSFPAVLHPVTASAPLMTLMKITPALSAHTSRFVKISPQQFQLALPNEVVKNVVPPKTNDLSEGSSGAPEKRSRHEECLGDH